MFYKLTRKKDFDNVFKKGRSSYDQIIGVKFIDNNSDFSRFGIIVSTKISKKAVDRNRIKRRIREVLNSQIDNIKTGKDCIVITLPTILQKNYKEIEESLNNHLKKMRLYKTDK